MFFMCKDTSFSSIYVPNELYIAAIVHRLSIHSWASEAFLNFLVLAFWLSSRALLIFACSVGEMEKSSISIGITAYILSLLRIKICLPASTILNDSAKLSRNCLTDRVFIAGIMFVPCKDSKLMYIFVYTKSLFLKGVTTI